MQDALPPLRIISAGPSQLSLILGFIRKLAEYERLAHEVVADEHTLSDYLFGERPAAEVILAYSGEQAVGFALFFTNFSTFLGRPGIYLEDLFVEQEARGKGIGKALLQHLARLTVERGYGRLNWAVLDWNEPSIGFYKSLGAEPQADWTTYQLSGEALREVAGSA